MTSMTSCIVGKKIRAMGPGPLDLFPFVVLAILMAMAGGISEDMLTSWSSLSSVNQHIMEYVRKFLDNLECVFMPKSFLALKQ